MFEDPTIRSIEVPMKQTAVMKVKDSFVDERLLALQHILQSETFSSADSMRNFLEFIVEKSRQGELMKLRNTRLQRRCLADLMTLILRATILSASRPTGWEGSSMNTMARKELMIRSAS